MQLRINVIWISRGFYYTFLTFFPGAISTSKLQKSDQRHINTMETSYKQSYTLYLDLWRYRFIIIYRIEAARSAVRNFQYVYIYNIYIYIYIDKQIKYTYTYTPGQK